MGLTALYLAIAAGGGNFAVDFEHNFWVAGRHVLHGQSPFPPVTRQAISTGFAFVYPPPMALLMAPFALLPMHVAGFLFTACLGACAVLSLYAVGVRDWRCYAAIFLWRPVLSGLQTANLTLLLALGAALLWRYRDRRALAAVIGGAVVSLKIFLWPLVIWLVATRRYAAGVGAAVAAMLMTLVSWAVLGFAGLHAYVPALKLMGRIYERTAYTPFVVGLRLGLGSTPARIVGFLLAGVILGALVVVARRGEERQAFALALAASILASPLVWLHYFAIFIVALGVLRPRYGVVWVVPLLTLLAPPRLTGPSWWAVDVLVSFAALLVVALMPPRETRPERAPPPPEWAFPGAS